MDLRVVGVSCCGLLAAAFAFPAAGRAAPTDPVGRRLVTLGRSVAGRPITAVETGDFDSPRKTLVVGCIHGNECAGVPVALRLARRTPPRESDLWIVPDINPDGAAAHTRGNARGVDLNRNFPQRWARLTGVYDSGPAPLSEPEARVAYRLIRRVRPVVSIWFHQHLDLVDDSTGSQTLERRFAHAAGLRLVPLRREPGSVVTWQTYCYPAATAFVVELPAGPLSAAAVARFAGAAFLTIGGAPAARPKTAAACSG